MNEDITLGLYNLAKDNIFLNIFVVFFGQYFLYILVFFAATILFFTRQFAKRHYYIALPILTVILTNGILVPAINYFYDNPRPFVALEAVSPLIVHSTNSSMPSGHMMFMIPIALTLFYINKKIGLWFLAGTILTGISRIAAGVHWPADIIIGILLASLCFYLVKAVLYLGGLKTEPNG